MQTWRTYRLRDVWWLNFEQLTALGEHFDDMFVCNGDEIYIPKKPNVVIVEGSVYNPTAITYKPGAQAGWYLKQAGEPTEMANERAVFVVRADG